MQSMKNTLLTPKLKKPLAALGGLWASYHLYKLASFTWLHFLRPSSLHRYKKVDSDQDAAWALVTGASDGIGKGFAEELCHRGFNVILHGRNEQKLNGVKADVQRRWPAVQVRHLILDAASSTGDEAKLRAAVEELKDVNLKVLVNNVGGGADENPLFRALQNQTNERVNMFIDVNAGFATQLTRLLLPQLIKQQPALVINVSSGVAELPVPYISILSGCKAYNTAWSRSMQGEMWAEGHDIEFLTILMGTVATERTKRTENLMQPSSRKMASSSLDAVGCGKTEIWAYWGHALQFALLPLLPTSVVEKVTVTLGRDMKLTEEKGLKAI